MSSKVSVFRTEIKYTISTDQKSKLISRLSAFLPYDANGGEEGYPVRSLYFDSIFDDDYIDKLEGIENRKKIRLRLYSPKQEKVKLELKQKFGNVQKKQSLWISRELAQQMTEGEYSGLLDIDDSFASELYAIMQMRVYLPKCLIEYNRIAFMEDTNNIRLTFDSDIRASRSISDFFSETAAYAPLMNDVFEVKYDGYLLNPISQVISIANTSPVSVSKYTLARELLG